MANRTNEIELVHIPLKDDDLLFYKSFVEKLGGVRNAKTLLLDIIDRYFKSKFFNPGLLEDLDIKLETPEDIWIE